MLQIRKIIHNGDYQIGLFFGFDDILKNKVRKIGAKWSNTHKCWYLLYNKENYNLVKCNFETFEIIIDNNDDRQIEPASIKHEIVHIADTISEIRPSIQAEHKDLNPEIAESAVYKGTSGKYWILKVPYKNGLPEKLKSVKGVYWNKNEKAYFVLRHINVKLKVEALLSMGEIFPSEFYNLETVFRNENTRIEIKIYEPDKKWMLLSCPRIPFLFEQIKRMEGSRFSKANNAYLINATPSSFNNIQKLGESLNIPVVNKLPDKYLSKYKALNRKASALLNIRQKLLQQVPVSAQNYTLAMVDYLLAQNYSANTIKNYTGEFNTFMRIIRYQNPDELTEMQIIKYLAYLTEKGFSPSKLNMLINALKYYYRMVLKRESFEINIPRPRKEQHLPTVLTMEECFRIFEKIENPKHRLLLLIGYGSGLRRSEIVSLQWSDILFEEHKIHIKQSKGMKDRMVMLPYFIIKSLLDYRLLYPSDNWVFQGQYKGEALSASTVQQVMKQAVINAGLEKKATVHTLRHSFATHLLESGTDIRYIQELLGHASIKTTMGYTHITSKAVKKIVSPLDNLMIGAAEQKKLK